MSHYPIKQTNHKKNIHNRFSKGFTLIELMVAITISGLMLSIAVPGLGSFIVKMRIDNEISQLNRLVLTARNSAVTLEENVIVCPLVSGVCTANWQDELTAFVDNDLDGNYNGAIDEIIRIKEANTTKDTITYAGQTSINFVPSGVLANNASTFIYCPESDAKLARAVVVTISGRTHVSADSNHDGRDEFRAGGTVNCP